MYRIIVKVGNEEIDVFNAYLSVVKDKSFFKGRLDRKTFLGFVWVNVVIYLLYCLLLLLLNINPFVRILGANLLLIVSLIYSLAILRPNRSALVKRLHDVGISTIGGFCLFCVPVAIVTAFFLVGVCKNPFQSNPVDYTFFDALPLSVLYSPLLALFIIFFFPAVFFVSAFSFLEPSQNFNFQLKLTSLLLLLIGVLVILCSLPGTEGENKYGDAPEVVEVKSSKVRKDIKS